MIQMTTIGLSKRELEIMDKISVGLTTKEIASLLYLSTHTVVSHRKNMLEKMKVPNTAGLVRRAFENGILPVPQYQF